MDGRQMEMKDTLASIHGVVRENESLLRGLHAQTGSQAAELVERLSTLASELEITLRRLQTGTARVSQDSTAGPDARVLYEEAYLQFQQGNYGTASEGFDELLLRYPESALADDAMYFMALSHEADGQHHRAIENLVTLYHLYHASEKAPAAVARAARIYADHSALRDAERLWALLLERYPESDEAALRRESTQ
jgi:TolA-binding protein